MNVEIKKRKKEEDLFVVNVPWTDERRKEFSELLKRQKVASKPDLGS